MVATHNNIIKVTRLLGSAIRADPGTGRYDNMNELIQKKGEYYSKIGEGYVSMYVTK